jgi:hypothetical protein
MSGLADDAGENSQHEIRNKFNLPKSMKFPANIRIRCAELESELKVILLRS